MCIYIYIYILYIYIIYYIYMELHGDPKHTNLRGRNVHLPPVLMFARHHRVLTHPCIHVCIHIYIYIHMYLYYLICILSTYIYIYIIYIYVYIPADFLAGILNSGMNISSGALQLKATDISASSILIGLSDFPWQTIYSGWWFGTFFDFPYIVNVIFPTDFHIFLRGRLKPPTRSIINHH